MNSLRERLSRMMGGERKQKQEVQPSPISSSSFLPWDEEPNRYQEVVENQYGSFLRLRRSYPIHTVHGRYELGELIHVKEGIRLLSPDIGELDEWLFIDTETTGLSAGAGNFPFLVGTAFFEETHVVVDQFFLRDPSEEAAMLAELDRLLMKHPHLVSYNGKSFDWPLLRNRWVLYRMNPSAQLKSHIDLLYPARSLWRGVLQSCRLGEVEVERLGIERLDDLPGSYAPIYYMNYLAEGDPNPLKAVFRHNEWDLLTLISLTIYLGRLLMRKENFFSLEEEELFRLALWFERMNLTQMADAAFQDLLERPARRRERYMHAIASVFKKRGELKKAVSIWTEYISQRGKETPFQVDPYLELAKYYEHSERDYETALSLAEEAYSHLLMRRSLLRGKKEEEEVKEIKKRIVRLREKLARQKKESSLFECGNH